LTALSSFKLTLLENDSDLLERRGINEEN